MNASSDPKLPDPAELSRTMSRIADQSQRIVSDFVERHSQDGGAYQVMDPLVVVRSFNELLDHLMSDPTKMMEAQLQLWTQYMSLYENTARRLMGETVEPVAVPEPADRRFKSEDWSENPVFDFVKQSYLLASRYLQGCVRNADGLSEHEAQKLDFYTRQFVDAMAPTNFVSTNPEVIRKTLESGGENLLRGLTNLLDDLERGKGKLRIRMTDLERFTLGENVATTPGKVVYQNDLMQLIQYSPTTEKVFKRPLLIIPPWINKYYILDLRPKNSFVRWAVEEGHTVFIISWVNPDKDLADKDFEDYMLDGPLAALDAMERATGERDANVIGYCLGGTLLAATLAYMKEKSDDRIKAATLFTSMTDFSEPGELGVFIDEEQLDLMEKDMEKSGFFDGAAMAEAFNLLRANDLIWAFVVNNYLLGQDPFPFDLLYWNSDSTRMPARMHSFYLRKMYQQNLLAKPGAIALDGVPIDLRRVDTPVYLLSTKEDHIAPWRATYAATRLYSGPMRFVLGMSGHIAGVVNPPASKKYGYWTNESLPEDPEEWLVGAQSHEGSWWLDWSRWISALSKDDSVPARTPGDHDLPVLEDAPGSYVKVRAD